MKLFHPPDQSKRRAHVRLYLIALFIILCCAYTSLIIRFHRRYLTSGAVQLAVQLPNANMADDALPNNQQFSSNGKEMICWSPVTIRNSQSLCRVLRIINSTATTCDEYLFATWEAMNNSKWTQKAINRGAKVVFISDPCVWDDSCKMKEIGKWNMGLRSKLMWKYLHKNYPSSKWFWRIDDDTFFSGSNARKYLSQYNPQNEYFFGLQINRWVSGMAFALSAASLRKMVNNFDSPQEGVDCSLENRMGDDKATSFCLVSLNISIKNIEDSDGYHALGAFFIGDARNYTHYLPRPGREAMDQSLFFENTIGRSSKDIGCCSKDLIGYHAPFKTCDDEEDGVWYEMYEKFV